MINHFPNYGFLIKELSNDEFAPILDSVNKIQKEFKKAIPLNLSLAGHIRHEYQLPECQDHIGNLALCLAKEYFGDLNRKYKIHTPWVNFQKKTEFNPPHQHTGDLSYVIWVKVPYLINQEKAIMSHVNPANNITGHFNFHFLNVIGNLATYPLPVDKTWEKRMIIFPAQLSHSVSPFYTSNEYRISVAGNLEQIQ
jgi:hypothetical protein